MSYTVEKIASNRAKISFEIDVETFDKSIQAAYRKNVTQINVPGFRRGKAPRKVIEGMYGESIFYEDAFDSLFPTIYQEAITEHKLQPVDQPDVNMENIGNGKPLVFSLEVFVSPDVTLGEYKGLRATEPTWTVTDEQVMEKITAAQERIARWVEVDRAIANGDRATIDYLGTIDSVPFEGGTAEKMPLDIGSGTFIPGFEEQLLGCTVGQEKDVVVSFPEDYNAQDLAGKEANFHVTIHEIKSKELPELDDEFAKDVSEFDTLDEYKQDTLSKLTESAKLSAQNASDNQLILLAVENATMDLPDAMVESQINTMLRDFQMRLAYQGMNMENFMSMTGQSMEDVRAQFRADATSQVKAELTIEAIRKVEGYEPNDDQVQQQIDTVAKSMGRPSDEFKASMTPRDWEYMRDAASGEMVMELLRKHAVYTKQDDTTPDADPASEKEPAAKKDSAKKKKDTTSAE